MKLFFTGWLLFLAMSGTPGSRPVCDSIKYEISIVHTTNGQSNGRIEVKILRAASQVKAFLYPKSGRSKNLKRDGVGLDKLDNLPAGKYILVLQDKNCSVVESDITIK